MNPASNLAAVPAPREQPLTGCTVVVTRAKAQAGGLAERLERLGARVLQCPLIRIERVSDPGPLDDVLDRLEDFDWIAFTSGNAVECFFQRLVERGMSDLAARPVSARPSFAVVGAGTAAKLSERGLMPDLVAQTALADSLATELIELGVRSQRVLFPRGRIARETLPRKLEEAGAIVESVVVYETLADDAGALPLKRALAEGAVDIVTFGSASTVESFHALTSDSGARSYQIVSIGPITTSKAVELGYTVAATAREHTVDGLIDAIVGAVRQRG
ncbi:MAG: uroporphyrinogen-III synthase [Candidatus Wallbacteria bacterium]|nr:uroporphyrinogen-III synthase [Candidatus Wallbacteria bacterium]